MVTPTAPPSMHCPVTLRVLCSATGTSRATPTVPRYCVSRQRVGSAYRFDPHHVELAAPTPPSCSGHTCSNSRCTVLGRAFRICPSPPQPSTFARCPVPVHLKQRRPQAPSGLEQREPLGPQAHAGHLRQRGLVHIVLLVLERQHGFRITHNGIDFFLHGELLFF